jgi:hypothetical protein
MPANPKHPTGPPMTLGNTMNSENYRHLAEEEAALAVICCDARVLLNVQGSVNFPIFDCNAR